MDLETARWLVSDAAVGALAAASRQPDPASLAAAELLRRDHPPAQAAAALSQAGLRRRAAGKLGADAAAVFWTPAGLEQATRAEVAGWRAQRFADAGVGTVVDLGCGVGIDALAFAAAGLEVVAVEVDPVTAVLAEANLGRRVRCGDAMDLADELLAAGAAVFADPARRTAAGRTWRVADFSPPWEFVTGLLVGRFGCIKAAPGLPSALIPPQAGVTWVSHRRDLVETSLWSEGERRAVLLPGGQELASGPPPEVGELGRWLYEPDPAVIRAGAVGNLARQLSGRALAPRIAYLSADEPVVTAFATSFEVVEVLDYQERVLRGWVRDHQVGSLEIKVRGIEVDPAQLRRRLKPRGSAAATLILTPTIAGAKALVVRRTAAGTRPGSELS